MCIKEFIADLELLNAETFDSVDFDTTIMIERLIKKWKGRLDEANIQKSNK